jgi:hypothetical protein
MPLSELLDESQSSWAASGTTTCSPLPPLVFRKLRMASCSRSERISYGAFLHLAPGDVFAGIEVAR